MMKDPIFPSYNLHHSALESFGRFCNYRRKGGIIAFGCDKSLYIEWTGKGKRRGNSPGSFMYDNLEWLCQNHLFAKQLMSNEILSESWK